MAPSRSQIVKRKMQGKKKAGVLTERGQPYNQCLTGLFTHQKGSSSLSSEVGKKKSPIIKFYGLNCVSQNSYIEALSPKVTVFGIGVSRRESWLNEVRRVQS